MCFCTFFLNCLQKPHANPTIINEKIKEIHILTVGDVPGISNFKSRASLPCGIFGSNYVYLCILTLSSHWYEKEISTPWPTYL